jgi:hypothetical protein
MAFTKPSVALGLGRQGGGPDRHTDKNEFLSAGVLIAYRERPGEVYPTQQMKNALQDAAVQARNIVRVANDIFAKVVLLRRPESQLFQDTLAKHFDLVAGDLAGGLLVDNIVDKPFSPKAVFAHDRRWILEKIRQKLLSLSFHLNTGMYLIDQDNANRDVWNGVKDPNSVGLHNDWVGYVHMRGTQTSTRTLCGFRNGEMHISFEDVINFSLNTNAAIIIHEAAHKFLGAPGGVGVDIYANNPIYPPLLNQQNGSLAIADSVTWTAVSLATGAVRMLTHDSGDWANCPGPAL